MSANNGLAYDDARSVTPGDGIDYRKLQIIGVMCLVDGTIELEFATGNVLLLNAIAGERYEFAPKFILAGSTATGIKALF